MTGLTREKALRDLANIRDNLQRIADHQSTRLTVRAWCYRVAAWFALWLLPCLALWGLGLEPEQAARAALAPMAIAAMLSVVLVMLGAAMQVMQVAAAEKAAGLVEAVLGERR